MPIRISGATTARSSPIRIRNTTSRMIGGITVESQPAASRTSNSTAVGPPISVPGADRVGRVADRRDQFEGVSRVGVRREHRLDEDAGRPFGDGGGDRLDAVDPATVLRTAGDFGAVGDDDVGQRRGPGGEALVEQVLAFGRLDFGPVAVFAGQVGREGGEAGAENEQQGDRAGHDSLR